MEGVVNLQHFTTFGRTVKAKMRWPEPPRAFLPSGLLVVTRMLGPVKISWEKASIRDFKRLYLLQGGKQLQAWKLLLIDSK